MEAQSIQFKPDELPGFEVAQLSLPEEGDGEICASLVRSLQKSGETAKRPAVLYLHGYCDYFFQAHMARHLEEAGFRFFALDLRRYGRSLRPHNLPNQATSVSDYFRELDWAIQTIGESHSELRGVVAHSTGGLILAHYMDHGRYRERVRCVILNSPFFRLHLRPVDQIRAFFAAQLGRVAPRLLLPQKMKSTYGKTLHTSFLGRWDYDTNKKPISGFPLYAGWFHMIRQAQLEVRRGLNIQAPVLVLHSSHSRLALDEPDQEDFKADIVLNVEDIRKMSLRLGRDVRLYEIENGLHDLVLSDEPAQSQALKAITDFLCSHANV